MKVYYFLDLVHCVDHFAEKKNLATLLSSIIFSLALCLNSKKFYFSFLFFERQLLQIIGPLADIANRVVFRNIRGNEKFIKEKLVG